MPIRSVAPAELNALRSTGPIELIDVRTPAEFSGGHVPGARNVPLDQLERNVNALRQFSTLHVICQGGVRSRKACEQLATAGLTDLVDVTGGTNAWKNAGLPVEGSGKSTFGVERQVRCVIGGAVLLGAVLALTVNPWWAALSGFFGAGLLMAGITDFCGLALVIAAMPWNRSAAPIAGGSCCVPVKSAAADSTNAK